MFDSLDEQIRKDEDRVSGPKARMMKYALYALAGAAIFGAVFWGFHMVG